MEQTITVKVRLYPTSEQASKFVAVTEEYRHVCNIVSQWYFNEQFKPTVKVFQKVMYHQLRAESKLNSMMVQSVFRTVLARYRTVQTQLRKKPFQFYGKDENGVGRRVTCQRNLTWLTKPIRFKRPQADYLRQSNYSFVEKATKISLNVLGERIKACYNAVYARPLLAPSAKLGTAKLISLKGHWFLHIPMTLSVPDWSRETNQHIVGIDRGLRFATTAYDEQGQTEFACGKRLAYKRNRYAYTRAKLQAKGTKSAKRHLKKLAQRENCWMNDVNHCLSKTLVGKYGANTLFVLEDLIGVSFDHKRVSKKAEYQLRSWSFYDLQMKLTYKAHLMGSEVILVAAQYTSQRCPRCCHIDKANRNHHMHEYHCDNCGFRTNDDRVGAMNLYELGKQYLDGDEHPKFAKTNSGSD